MGVLEAISRVAHAQKQLDDELKEQVASVIRDYQIMLPAQFKLLQDIIQSRAEAVLDDPSDWSAEGIQELINLCTTFQIDFWSLGSDFERERLRRKL